MTKCLDCWRRAAAMTHIYTRRGGKPITTVQLYRERHAEHMAAMEEGREWFTRAARPGEVGYRSPGTNEQETT